MAVSAIVPTQAKKGKHCPTLNEPPRARVEFVDAHGAAEILGITPSTLGQWRMKRTGPPFLRLHGSRIRYRVDELLTFAQAERVTHENAATE